MAEGGGRGGGRGRQEGGKEEKRGGRENQQGRRKGRRNEEQEGRMEANEGIENERVNERDALLKQPDTDELITYGGDPFIPVL